MPKRARAKQQNGPERQPDRRPDPREELIGVLNKFEIRSPVAVSFDREPESDVRSFQSVHASGAASGQSDDMLIKAIQAVLYDRCYARRLPRASASDATQAASADIEFGRRLAAANAGSERWDRGWIIHQFGPNGQAFVRKGDRERVAVPGAFIFDAAPGMTPQIGSSVSVRAASETYEAQPGYYFAFGESLDELADSLSLTRLYFHCRAEDAALLVSELTAALNRFQTRSNSRRRRRLRSTGARTRPSSSLVGAISPSLQESSPSCARKSGWKQRPPSSLRRCGRASARLSNPARAKASARTDAASWRKASSMHGGAANNGRRHAMPQGRRVSPPRASTSSARGLARAASTRSAATGEAALSAARQRFFEAAARIRRRLCRDAVWHDGRCNWLGWAMEPHGGQRVSAHRAMGVTVYDGAADDVSILAEAETAVRTTAAMLGQASLGTGNFSLCHGDGGNADLLILATDLPSRPDVRREAEEAGARALDRFEDTRSPWPCGSPRRGRIAKSYARRRRDRLLPSAPL
jgi:hypothetical protein